MYIAILFNPFLNKGFKKEATGELGAIAMFDQTLLEAMTLFSKNYFSVKLVGFIRYLKPIRK